MTHQTQFAYATAISARGFFLPRTFAYLPLSANFLGAKA